MISKRSLWGMFMYSTALEGLRATIEHIDGAYAPNTIRAYRADMEEFIAYCDKVGECALPAEPDTVAGFLLSVTGIGIKSATVRRKVSSISAIHRLSNLEDPTKHSEVRIAVRKMHRQLGRNFSQAYGITRPLLDQLLAVVTDDLRGKRDRALLLVAYETLRRRTELVSLLVEDVEWLTDGRAVIMLRQSKTDQEGCGKWLHLGEQAATALRDWLDSAGLVKGFVFRGIDPAGKPTAGLGGGQVARIYKRLAANAGLAKQVVQRISGHSLRVGGAQDLLVQGASLPQIMVKGGWQKTDTVMRYVERIRMGAAVQSGCS